MNCDHVFGESVDAGKAVCIKCGAPDVLKVISGEQVNSKDKFGG